MSESAHLVETGTSLAVYGAPKRQIQHLGQTPGKQELCLQGTCRQINAEEIYNRISDSEQDLPVLLWTMSNLVENRYHRLELRLMDVTGDKEPVKAMTIHHLEYLDRAPMLP